jgi:pimeloyl-ACP methyl ester carboxylesterase
MPDPQLPVVLVHGGAHGAWCWAPLLPALGADAIAVDLPPVSIRGGPGRNALPPGSENLTLADCTAAVLAAADDAGFERFVLVGHSMGGLTICDLARSAPERVAHLVFVSALVPSEGTAGFDAMLPEIMDPLDDGMSELTAVDMFCSDLDPAQTQFVLDHIGTEAAQLLAEPVHRAGTPADMPMTYVRLSQDHALPPAAQDASIAALRAVPGGTVNVVELDSGHSAMISHPADLAAILNSFR